MKDIFGGGEIGRLGSLMDLSSDFSIQGLQSNLMRSMPWTPSEIATLLWLDASDTSTATIVDGKISQRADKSGNGLHAAQAVAANMPVAGTNKDVYDGIDDRLVIPNTAMLNAPAYIAVVCKPSITSQYHGFIDKRGSSSGWMLDSGPTATAGRPRITVTSTVLVAPTSVHNTLAIIEAQRAGSSSFVGTPASVNTGALPTPSINTENISIGGQGARTASLNMDFHEAVILPAAPSTALRQMIQGYLAHKWDTLLGTTALVSALPSYHPYKLIAPIL